MAQESSTSDDDDDDDVISEIGAEGIVKSRYLPDGVAVAVIIAPSSTGWSGVFQGSDTVQESFDGAGNGYKSFKCDSGGIYGLSVQKTTEDGSTLRVEVWQEGEKLREADTEAAYGILTFSGNCR